MPTLTRAHPLDHVLAARRNLQAALTNMTQRLQAGRARVFLLPLYRGHEGGEGMPVCINPPETGDLLGLEGVDPNRPFQPGEFIPVWKPRSAAAGMQAALAIYQKISRPSEQPPSRPDRLPGLVWLPNPGQALEAIRQANICKENLRIAVEELSGPKKDRKTRRERQDLFKGTEMEHTLLLEALRQVIVIEEPVDRIAFAWSGGSRVVTNVTKDALLETLKGYKYKQWYGKWEAKIVESGDEYFARARDVEPFPIANYRVGDRWVRRLSVSMPVILTCRHEPEVSDLVSYLRLRELPPPFFISEADVLNPAEDRAASPATPESQLQGRLRGRREDRILEGKALIPEIGVYRYTYESLRRNLPPPKSRRGRARTTSTVEAPEETPAEFIRN